MRTMKKHLRIAACYFRLNLASALEYRASFLSQAFGMALSNSSFIFFWWVAFSQLGGRIGGYAFEDVLFIWATCSTLFGLSQVLFGNARRLSALIVSGELDTFLLQPCNVLLNLVCAHTSLSAYGDIAYGFILMALSQGGQAAAWGWFLAAVVLGALLFTALTLLAHSVTFWVGNAAVLGDMVTEFVINFSIYPEGIYGPVIRAIMYSLIPAGLMVHVPLRLARQFTWGWALALLPLAALYCAAAAWVFFRGLRRYESGNVIVMRQ